MPETLNLNKCLSVAGAIGAVGASVNVVLLYLADPKRGNWWHIWCAGRGRGVGHVTPRRAPHTGWAAGRACRRAGALAAHCSAAAQGREPGPRVRPGRRY